MKLSRLARFSVLVIGLFAVAGSAPAETPIATDGRSSAESVAAPGVVEIETRDESGDLRRTKIWIVALGDTVYVRTTGSRWNANLLRDGGATLHSDDRTADVEAERVSDPELQSSVNALFAAKYGFANTLRNFAVGLGSANMWALTLVLP